MAGGSIKSLPAHVRARLVRPAHKGLSEFAHWAPKGGEPGMVMPLNVLEKSINKRIQLLLKDNRQLEGKLVGYDDYMNMVLEDTEETKDENVRRIGTVVLRGNNVVAIVPR